MIDESGLSKSSQDVYGAECVSLFILCHNNLHELRLCIRSILSRTIHPFKIVVVDNSSSDPELLNFLNEIRRNKLIDVVYCRFNLWVLGFNKAIKIHLSSSSKFFVATDADIIVPPVSFGKCWLGRLVSEMESNINIGKLGISLDLGYIKNRPIFYQTYLRELEYLNGPRVGSNCVAPVDTTLAIYRSNFFMTSKPRFYPGHGLLGRPEYLICRTDVKFCAKHIGWRSYKNSDSLKKYMMSKLYCFALVGAYLDRPFLDQVHPFHSAIFRVIRPIARLIWAVNVALIQISWFVRNFPFKLNGIQNFRRF